MRGLAIARALWLAAALALAGCATLPRGTPAPGDPFERFNRTVFRMNSALDHSLLRPVARGSRRLPAPIMTAATNFVSNVMYPFVLVNDFLEGKFRASVNDLERLAVNCTLGMGGLLDPATAAHLARNRADFGITLGKWGVPGGPFLMLPFLGPSNLRDALAMAPEDYAYVVIPGPAVGAALIGTDLLQTRAALLPADPLIDSAFDPYALERCVYVQERAFLVSGTPEPSEAARDPPGRPSAAAGPSRRPRRCAPVWPPPARSARMPTRPRSGELRMPARSARAIVAAWENRRRASDEHR